MDFTDSENPFEIAYFDRGPMLEETLLSGGFWSTYYYKGFIFGTEMVRGLDILELIPSDHLSKHEIAAAITAFPKDGPTNIFNPQQQVEMTWPITPTLALAYLDQVEREGNIGRQDEKELRNSLLMLEKGDANNTGKTSALINSYTPELSDRFIKHTEKTEALQKVLREISSI